MELHRETATLIILDLPPSALCGIDLISFNSSPRFKGIKLIPRGWHFVYTGITQSLSIRHGSWFFVSPASDAPPEVLVRQYNKEVESLDAGTEDAVITYWRVHLGSIWREALTPYRASVNEKSAKPEDDFVQESQDWNRLTDCLNEALLSRITGNSKAGNNWSLTSASSAARDADNIPGLQTEDVAEFSEKDLVFLPIDLKQTWRSGAVGRERTEAAQDRSWALQNLIKGHCNDQLDIIGELQFTFVMVLTLNNNSCLEQWKRILGLLLTCKSAPPKQPIFFSRFLSTLRLQLEHCQDVEGGLFDLSEGGASFLKMLLKRFRAGLEQQESNAKSEVWDGLEELEDFLSLEYGWAMGGDRVKSGYVQLEDGEEVYLTLDGADFEDESGDWAPAVVELTVEQAKALDLDEDTILSSQSGESALEMDVRQKLKHEEKRHAMELRLLPEAENSEVRDEDQDNDNEDDQDLDDMDARY